MQVVVADRGPQPMETQFACVCERCESVVIQIAIARSAKVCTRGKGIGGETQKRVFPEEGSSDERGYSTR